MGLSVESDPELKFADKNDKINSAILKLLLRKQSEVLSEIRNWLMRGEKLKTAIDEYLNFYGQITEHGVPYSLDRIKWVKAEGPSGPYEYADRNDNLGSEDFKFLLEDLKQHNGRMTRQGYFLWLFSNGDRVGRKQSKKEASGK